jgi:uncharacterized membrane protein YqjE
MPTYETDAQSQSFGTAAKTVAEHASAIVRLEIELATMELKRKIVSLALGIVLGLAAALFLLFMLGFVFAAIAAGFATFLATWLALLITAGILLAVAGLLGFLAIRRIQKGTPPVPQQAIREAKLTTNALKHDGTGA